MSKNKIKVLAVDDNIVNIKVLEQYLQKQNYEVIISESGEDAIQCFQSESPDIILMDIMMPGMSGLEATARIKAMAGDRWVPVIFMSALASTEDKIKGLDVGGDDYVTKPIEFNILGAKLKAMQRIASIQNKLSETMEKLREYKLAEDREQETAYELMESLFNVSGLENKDFHIWHVPAARFSGDLILAEKYSNDRMYILHADSTGHGLAAALPLLPVSQTFYDMAKKGYSIGKIARRMNSQLKGIMPISRFVAISLVLIDFDNNLVEVWNGGNPAVLIANEDREIVKEFNSQHLALGILEDEKFEEKTEFYQCTGNNVVVLYSDGLVEAENKNGQIYNVEDLKAVISREISAPELRNRIIEDVSAHLAGEKSHDDMSLIVINTQLVS